MTLSIEILDYIILNGEFSSERSLKLTSVASHATHSSLLSHAVQAMACTISIIKARVFLSRTHGLQWLIMCFRTCCRATHSRFSSRITRQASNSVSVKNMVGIQFNSDFPSSSLLVAVPSLPTGLLA